MASNLYLTDPIDYLLEGDIDTGYTEDDYRLLVKNCYRCPLARESSIPHVPNLLKHGAPYLFIGAFPSYLRNINEIQVFDRYRKGLGIEDDEYSYINMNCCLPRKGVTPTIDDVQSCKVHRANELSIIGDGIRVIFPMCNAALYWLFGPQSPTMGTMMGVVKKFGDIYVIPLPDPRELLVNTDIQHGIRDMLAECRLFLGAVEA